MFHSFFHHLFTTQFKTILFLLAETSSRVKGAFSTPQPNSSKPRNFLASNNVHKTPEGRFMRTPVSAQQVNRKRDLIVSQDIGSKENFSNKTMSYLPKCKGPGALFQERHSVGSPLRSTPTRNSLRNSEVLVKVSTPEIYTAVRFETPRKSTVEDMGPGVEKSNLMVAVRIRPHSLKEEINKRVKETIEVKNKEVNVFTDYGQTHSFTYDHCFSSCQSNNIQFGDQAKVYDSLAKPLLAKAFEGFNTCLFAYGQTGSGKSFSIMGNIAEEKELHETAGIVPRFCFDLFRRIENMKKKNAETIQVQISYFEIYKEKIQDLLSPAKASLRIREHPQNVKNLSFFNDCFKR